MKIAVIGGGPGGLYFSILTKMAMPSAQIDVFERNKADDSFGFGVVFSDETLSEFLTRDPKSYDLIRTSFAYWDELDVARDGEKVRISGNGFCGCSRKKLLQLLQQRCTEEGVNLHFETEKTHTDVQHDYDIVVAADGIGSKVRQGLAEYFGTKIEQKRNRFVWMGSTKPLDAFTYFFRNTEHGPIVAHSYQYEENRSTWIFECTPETYEKCGFKEFDEEDTIAKIKDYFKEELDGHGLISNRSHWRHFPHITNDKWSKDNIVLLGDAKATAHYSIGSGTKLAMESAIALSDAIVANTDNCHKAFEQYDAARRNRVEMIQYAAEVSLDWFENMDRHISKPFNQFAFGVMTRAKKVTFENMAIRDASFTQKVLEEYNALHHTNNKNLPAAFAPYTVGTMPIENRIVMAPMGQYKAKEGVVNDWHKVHYGTRAIGGVGLIIAEMTAVSSEGRITEACAGLYNDEQSKAWKTVTDFVHQNSNAKIAVQLGHSGPKGGGKIPWEAAAPEIKHELLSASAIPFNPDGKVPKAMTVSDMDSIKAEFVRAVQNADAAGFDMIELQAHHGFLLATFISPLTNKRTDEFGGDIHARLKFPLVVFEAMRKAWPKDKPMSVRISACDWAEGGTTEEESIIISEAFSKAGADIIHVSTGLTVAHQEPKMGRMWQTPFSDTIKNEADVPTITCGYIQDIDQINTILLNNKADLVALGRPLLLDPYFVRNAMAYEQIDADVPSPYTAGKSHLYPFKKSERRMVEGMKKALKPESHQTKK